MRAPVLTLLLCLGCDGSKYDPKAEQRQYLESNIVYFYDKQTALCFAGANLGYSSSVLTQVPCTEQVMARCDFVGSFPKSKP